MDKAIVITTINSPRKEITEFAKLKDWTLICVGDTKTPENWKHENAIYLSPSDQARLFPKMLLPWNCYARKNIGYLYAIKEGAKVVMDTDDDVFYSSNFPPDISKNKKVSLIKGRKFINIFEVFGSKTSWPRGFPINYVNHVDSKKELKMTKENVFAPLQTSLIDDDSDFDAIYRLLYDKRVFFNKTGEYALAKGSYCPINTQNTFSYSEIFPLLYIPAFINPHVEDIWRGYIAQRLVWEIGGRVVFMHPTVYTSERNQHDYLKDFEHELPLFLQTNKLVAILDSLSLGSDLHKSLIKVYEELAKEGIMNKSEVAVVTSWIREIERLS